MRLLVVEDEPRISELIKAALERAEFAVDGCEPMREKRWQTPPTMPQSSTSDSPTVTG